MNPSILAIALGALLAGQDSTRHTSTPPEPSRIGEPATRSFGDFESALIPPPASLLVRPRVAAASASHPLLGVIADRTEDVALEDVDGDGDRDALIGKRGQNRLYLNDGSGVFADATATHLPAVLHDTQSLSLGDIDGDGDRDLLIGFLLYLNNGSGVFNDVTILPCGSPRTGCNPTAIVELVDFDADGALDALVAEKDYINYIWGRIAGRMRLFLNDGSGIFGDATASHLPALWVSPVSLAIGDVDGDGDRDFLVGNLVDRASWPQVVLRAQISLYANDATGHFSGMTAANLPARALVLGDLDGDGDEDALVANPPRITLLLNNGSGLFTNAAFAAARAWTEALALGDVDGDGDADVLAGNIGQDRLYLSDGAGVFTDVTSTHLPVDFDATRALALEDVDGDGDRDALIGNYRQQNRLYLNDGAGVFTDVTSTNLP